jgi:hypothetical protein
MQDRTIHGFDSRRIYLRKHGVFSQFGGKSITETGISGLPANNQFRKTFR